MTSEQKPTEKAPQSRLYLLLRWGTISFAIISLLSWIVFYLGLIASASSGALDLAELAELYLAFATMVFALVFAMGMVLSRRPTPAKAK